ncbi:ABC transporter permease [Flavobacterium sp. MAH-1]|uniref:ABC transporter permease n=1 Tax=Flavobacterium agri TaxID=2743471 RepID=A0A7Y9C5K3_9FLAO|nr:ABC transporter permease [Flavobacterium agri]NUY81061.1 ABC transporter permease [Flavobacterium agri]NYA71085.1 ABC transporter permease [Flavobacterium agri]
MSALTLIIKREFIAKVRNKSFIVMTFLSPLLFAGIAVLVGYLSSLKADVQTIAIHDETGLFVNEFKSGDAFKYENQSSVAVEILRDSIKSGKYEGVLFIPKAKDSKSLEKSIKYYSDDDPGIAFVAGLEDIIASKLTETNYVNAKLDTLQIRNAEANVEISLSKSSGEVGLKYFNEIKIAFGCAFGYLIMMFIIIYGNMVMRSVIEEKTNRIIEIIISSVKPFQLMMGKIIGTSLAGVLQFVIWSIIGVLLLLVAASFFGVTPGVGVSGQMASQASQMSDSQLYIAELGKLPIGTMIFAFIVYFIGGYFLYSSVYAAIGAAVDSETDSQQFMMPIIMPLMLGVYIGVFTVINDPHGTVATTFSMIPLTSPIVMLMRIPFGVPWWQIALSMGILFGTFFAVVWFAAKIYRIGILMYGKKPTWKEMFKWMRYSG